jgi:hypothetical protein
MRARLLLIPIILAVAGCDTAQEFEDVSSASTYQAYIGVSYASKVEMHLSGVNAPPGYEKSVDYYVVKPSAPSWSGPELISRETLPVGTVLRVESVHRCKNCVFGKLIKAKITLPGYKGRIDLPVHIPLQYLGEDFARRL